jgi:hypothetical protein
MLKRRLTLIFKVDILLTPLTSALTRGEHASIANDMLTMQIGSRE